MFRSPGLIVFALALIVGAYLYKTNFFASLDVEFGQSPDGVSVVARGGEYHNCKLKLTNDYEIEILRLMMNSRLSIPKNDFKQWNGVILENMSDLGVEIDFRLRCDEGHFDLKVPNNYAPPPQ